MLAHCFHLFGHSFVAGSSYCLQPVKIWLITFILVRARLKCMIQQYVDTSLLKMPVCGVHSNDGWSHATLRQSWHWALDVVDGLHSHHEKDQYWYFERQLEMWTIFLWFFLRCCVCDNEFYQFSGARSTCGVWVLEPSFSIRSLSLIQPFLARIAVGLPMERDFVAGPPLAMCGPDLRPRSIA